MNSHTIKCEYATYLLDDVPRRRAISGGGSIIAVILGIPGGFGTPSPAPGASKFSFESPPSGASSVGGVVLSDSAGVAAGRERAGESPLMPVGHIDSMFNTSSEDARHIAR